MRAHKEGHKSHMRYSFGVEINPEGFDPEKDIKNDWHGLADSMLIVHVYRDRKNKYEKSFALAEIDGNDSQSTEIPAEELFQIWCHLAMEMGFWDRSKKMKMWQRRICRMATEAVKGCLNAKNAGHLS